MASSRSISVHLVPELLPAAELPGSLAVVIDVLRATTTIIHALANGCTRVFPVESVENARELAGSKRAGRVILGGERGGKPIAGFDRGNSPCEYTAEACKGTELVLTTTNGTRALLKAEAAERVLIAGFVNFSSVCEQIAKDSRPVHLICAGTDGEVTLEDALLAGALVECFCDSDCTFNDSARLAWDCFEHHGTVLLDALKLSKGGANLLALGYDEDIVAAAAVDRFMIVPELRRSPLRLEIGSFGVVRKRWPHP
jgi:2-phosphosulfolactate phosphatase